MDNKKVEPTTNNKAQTINNQQPTTNNSPQITAILFDLDGTLTNTDNLHFQTWQEVLSEIGMEIDREFYDQRISGRMNAAIAQDILPHLPLQEGINLAAEKENRFRQRGKTLQRLPGLDQMLAWASQRQLKQAVVTNAPRQNATFMLNSLHLADYFPVVVLAEDVPHGKPHADPYVEALNRLGVSYQETIAFEDSPSGVRSAVAAQLYTIGVASTHSPSSLTEAGAQQVIGDFTDSSLWGWLNSLR
ncbi:HAD-IA family hydrolase [Spirulina sp. CS-785/01]|uniref:HAD family hydrolase n=1 Tax=Spirulina sp. CS-785/01 TaxID=3021716 RepID=UPI00232B3A0B|nr:HAD-IA family hydrolase [Spirulina sp. CS-785/01]MDB9314360.1 HAD-IA family hydrolase [Spirulina sp. CS-785/01]